MGDNAHQPDILLYRRPEGRALEGRGATPWAFKVAYLLMTLPIVYVATNSSVDPVPVGRAVALYVLIGIAIGAALFVVRRQPGNFVGWVALGGWSVLCCGAI